MTINMKNYNNISSDTGQDKAEQQSVWRIAISIVTLDKINMNENYNNISSDTGQDKNKGQSV